ncbi:PREDICTED: interleukin-13 receptor subunit alpha-1 [Elephantulus edwardii]|uniref:interleukin-13 receptor subunit alpha-1 n=1 Tax=Elephantulus edwardii TaxID=28737 RepID=UPI0003F09915|nr:PREDICTED: interleukin-13 receptor subunit alpha-1 [Elephantulus edwardii]
MLAGLVVVITAPQEEAKGVKLAKKLAIHKQLRECDEGLCCEWDMAEWQCVDSGWFSNMPLACFSLHQTRSCQVPCEVPCEGRAFRTSEAPQACMQQRRRPDAGSTARRAGIEAGRGLGREVLEEVPRAQREGCRGPVTASNKAARPGATRKPRAPPARQCLPAGLPAAGGRGGFPSAPAPRLPGGGAGKWELERWRRGLVAEAPAQLGFEARGAWSGWRGSVGCGRCCYAPPAAAAAARRPPVSAALGLAVATGLGCREWGGASAERPAQRRRRRRRRIRLRLSLALGRVEEPSTGARDGNKPAVSESQLVWTQNVTSEPRGKELRGSGFTGLRTGLGNPEQHPGEDQPPVTNLSVSIKNLCTIIWTWNPPEGASPNCSLWYFSHFDNKKDTKIAPETHRSKEVPLNERICLQVGTQCSTNESDQPKFLVEKCISPPEGDPESAVTELQCIWHNLNYMKCSWLPGNNTSPDTNYILYYWHSSLGKILQCEDIYSEGQRIGCSFNLKDLRVEQGSIQIMVKDNAGKIRPSFHVVPLNSNVKPDPPHIKNLSFTNNELYVEWKNPENFKSNCLFYEIEVNNSHIDTQVFPIQDRKKSNREYQRNVFCFSIPSALPDTLNTVRVRVKTSRFCFESDHLWSDWSPAMSIGKKPTSALYITVLLVIPFIVAGAIILLLLYLKRLKIIIFPPIPDPGKIFKEMFGDQNDDTLHWKKYDIYEKQTKEETDSVVLIENLKRGSSPQ